MHHPDMSLVGQKLPSIPLSATSGASVDLSRLQGTTVLYAYPRTSPPEEPPIEGWDKIPGARGCTIQSKGFAAYYPAIRAAGADHVFGLSTQDTAYQAEMKSRLELPFDVLSDSDLKLATALALPTVQAAGRTLLKRLTMIIRDGVIQHVFFPIEEPSDNAFAVLKHLQS